MVDMFQTWDSSSCVFHQLPQTICMVFHVFRIIMFYYCFKFCKAVHNQHLIYQITYHITYSVWYNRFLYVVLAHFYFNFTLF